MRKLLGVVAVLLVVGLSACRPAGTIYTILVHDHTYTTTIQANTPMQIIAAAGLTLGPNDRLLFNGKQIQADGALPGSGPLTFTIQPVVTITLSTHDGQKVFESSALTIGQALTEAGFTLYPADYISPPVDSPIQGDTTVNYQPSQSIQISVDGKQFQVRSAASNVGSALAEADIPLIALDTSIPPENDPLPADGKIQVVRLVETVDLEQQSIPYTTRTEPSADLELDQTALLQGGEPGLSVTRVRTLSTDGRQVSQKTESASIVRPPQDRILGYGTKVVIHTAVVDGKTIQYYRVLTLLATSYSPCRSGTSKCSFGTSSGLPVQKGTVAMVYSWYLAFGYDKLYIPGYGYATVGDVGGGPAGSHYWVDLGFSDADYQPVYGNMTVYFLAPVPKNLVYILP